MTILLKAKSVFRLSQKQPAARKPLHISTKKCKDNFAVARAYPRKTTVYTIRTPSPDGQHGPFRPMLPVFFIPLAATDIIKHLVGAYCMVRFADIRKLYPLCQGKTSNVQ